MKHSGKTPAIYASPKRAYLVQPGQTVPPRSRLIITHTDIEVLVLTLDRSTKVHPDGTREPLHSIFGSYDLNAEAVMRRIVNASIEEITLSEFQILRKALGSVGLSKSTPDLGWCNSVYISPGRPIPGDVVALVGRGLLEKCDTYPDFYRVTSRGRVIAGAPEGENN